MTVSTGECPECGGVLHVSVGQAFPFGELVWFRSLRCECCPFAIEEDGHIPEDEIRNEILVREGVAMLQVDAPEDRTRACVVTKQALGLEMADILHLRQIDTGCVATGTRVEMEWLRQRLAKSGINAHATMISPKQDTTHASDDG